jgi:hypothetical protein
MVRAAEQGVSCEIRRGHGLVSLFKHSSCGRASWLPSLCLIELASRVLRWTDLRMRLQNFPFGRKVAVDFESDADLHEPLELSNSAAF